MTLTDHRWANVRSATQRDILLALNRLLHLSQWHTAQQIMAEMPPTRRTGMQVRGQLRALLRRGYVLTDHRDGRRVWTHGPLMDQLRDTEALP